MYTDKPVHFNDIILYAKNWYPKSNCEWKDIATICGHVCWMEPSYYKVTDIEYILIDLVYKHCDLDRYMFGRLVTCERKDLLGPLLAALSLLKCRDGLRELVNVGSVDPELTAKLLEVKNNELRDND